MDKLRSWSAQQWVLAVGVMLCLGEWLQFSVKLTQEWSAMNSNSHKIGMDFAILSLFLIVLAPNPKTRWVVPVIAAIVFQMAASLTLHMP